MKMKRKAAALAALVLAFGAFPAYAVSPEFARTEAEWQVLRDNYLGFEEIPDLINEYNAAVQENQAQYAKDERRTKNARELRTYLLDLADDYDVLADDAGNFDPVDLGALGRGGAMAAASYRSTAESLRETADDAVADGEIIGLEYRLMEQQIVLNTQLLFISYYEAADARDTSAGRLDYVRRSYESAVRKKNVGMATETDVLTAQSALLQAEAALPVLEAAVPAAKKKLQTACGWRYESDAEIGPLPQPEIRIESIDLAADTQKALEQSVKLAIDRKKLKNAEDSGSLPVKEKYEKILADDSDSLRSAVRTAYDGLVSAVGSAENAETSLRLAQAELEAADRAYAGGTISAMELLGKQDALKGAEGSLKAARTAFLKAYYTYAAAAEGVTA